MGTAGMGLNDEALWLESQRAIGRAIYRLYYGLHAEND